MELSRCTLLLALVLSIQLAVSLGGRRHRYKPKTVPQPVQDAEELQMSASSEDIKRHEAMSRAEIVPLEEDISKPMRMQLMDNCRGLGRSCSQSEQCCTQRCLQHGKVCFF